MFSIKDVQQILFTFVNVVMGGAAGFKRTGYTSVDIRHNKHTIYKCARANTTNRPYEGSRRTSSRYRSTISSLRGRLGRVFGWCDWYGPGPACRACKSLDY